MDSFRGKVSAKQFLRKLYNYYQTIRKRVRKAFSEFQIPNYSRIIDVVCKTYKYICGIGWDIAGLEDGPVYIEEMATES